jgi:hypothetical protein
MRVCAPLKRSEVTNRVTTWEDRYIYLMSNIYRGSANIYRGCGSSRCIDLWESLDVFLVPMAIGRIGIMHVNGK